MQKDQPPAQAAPQAPLDMTGAGGSNIGVGAVPVPGEEEFSGNVQQPQPQMQAPPPNGGLPPGMLQ